MLRVRIFGFKEILRRNCSNRNISAAQLRLQFLVNIAACLKQCSKLFSVIIRKRRTSQHTPCKPFRIVRYAHKESVQLRIVNMGLRNLCHQAHAYSALVPYIVQRYAKRCGRFRNQQFRKHDIKVINRFRKLMISCTVHVFRRTSVIFGKRLLPVAPNGRNYHRCRQYRRNQIQDQRSESSRNGSAHSPTVEPAARTASVRSFLYCLGLAFRIRFCCFPRCAVLIAFRRKCIAVKFLRARLIRKLRRRAGYDPPESYRLLHRVKCFFSHNSTSPFDLFLFKVPQFFSKKHEPRCAAKRAVRASICLLRSQDCNNTNIRCSDPSRSLRPVRRGLTHHPAQGLSARRSRRQTHRFGR